MITRKLYENHNVEDMTYTQPTPSQIRTRYESLLEDLRVGRECEIGGYIISGSQADAETANKFRGNVFDMNTSTVSHAHLSVTLSRYENLLCDKVDITLEGTKLTATAAELTFSTNDERVRAARYTGAVAH